MDRLVYLAGPDVFLPDPLVRAAALKQICLKYGWSGVSPLDALEHEPPDWTGLSEARRIHLRNEAHIRSCAALIANLTPFRGPSADPGTVFEMGFMRALGRPVFGYTTTTVGFTERTLAWLGLSGACDRDGLLIESFGLTDNLMLDGAIAASGGILVAADVRPETRWSDLSGFEACVRRLSAGWRHFSGKNTSRGRQGL
jgi:nucleoside 2-deoxyribosyltransferase